MVDRRVPADLFTPFGEEPPPVIEDVPLPPRADPRRRRPHRILLAGLVVIVLLLGLAYTAFDLFSRTIEDNVGRIPGVFDQYGQLGPGSGPRPPSDGALTFLLAGTDSRAPSTGSDASVATGSYGAQRSDVLMIARISADRTRTSVVSIPRDSWVDIPGHGKNKINSAFSLGGPRLMIQAIEQLTGQRIDHFGVIDFAGFQVMVDAIGGIDVTTAAKSGGPDAGGPPSTRHLDGAQALAFVRQPDVQPGVDVARHQQTALQALLVKAADAASLTDPVALYRLIDATSQSVSVDDTLSNDGLRSLALDLRHLRPADVSFTSAPIGGSGREGAQSVVYLDQERSAALWAALRDGQ